MQRNIPFQERSRRFKVKYFAALGALYKEVTHEAVDTILTHSESGSSKATQEANQAGVESRPLAVDEEVAAPSNTGDKP